MGILHPSKKSCDEEEQHLAAPLAATANFWPAAAIQLNLDFLNVNCQLAGYNLFFGEKWKMQAITKNKI